jgi:hypothetical protein
MHGPIGVVESNGYRVRQNLTNFGLGLGCFDRHRKNRAA